MKQITVYGESSTGTKHSLEAVPTPGTRMAVGGFKFTVLGPNGKRHAAVKVTRADAKALRDYLDEMLEIDS